MGLFSSLRSFANRPAAAKPPRGAAKQAARPGAARTGPRRSAVEQLEQRQLLAADGLVPDEVLLGSVYFEEATGDDSEADTIQVSFEGGPAGTTLDTLVISGDKAGDGLSIGDVFFDTAPGGLGDDFGSVPLSIVGADGFEVTSVTVVDGGTTIVFDFVGFEAGETLVFSIDVDEFQAINPVTNEPTANSLVEGAEFEFSSIAGSFTAEGFEGLTLGALYYDFFDGRRDTGEAATGLQLSLPDDRYEADDDKSDRTAGAVAHAPLLPLASISGHVYHDRSDDGLLDAGEERIAGVPIELLDAAGQPTGVTTLTDAQGYYEFVNLAPGTYGVREAAQPSPYLDGKDTAGSNGGAAGNDVILGAVLEYGDRATDYNFGELLVGSISGRVHVSDDADCDFDNPDTPLAGVVIELLAADGTPVATTTTDAQGRYSFAGLPPGEYQVRQVQPTQFAGQQLFDGGERAGDAGGVVADDLITGIQIGSDQDAVDYDFCEHLGASLSGFVYHDQDDDGVYEPLSINGSGEDP
ncbi:MAG: SdrD B-like domain-containing protein, partial [Planctomycetota bacterium]